MSALVYDKRVTMVFLHVYWYLSCLAIVLLLSIKLYVDNMADDLGLGLTMTFSIVECQQNRNANQGNRLPFVRRW